MNEAARLVFHCQFQRCNRIEVHYPIVITTLQISTPSQYAQARNRVKATEVLWSVPHIVRPFYSHFIGDRQKMEIFTPRYTGDLKSVIELTMNQPALKFSHRSKVIVIYLIAQALSQMHTCGTYVHKDIKPDNILVNYSIQDDELLITTLVINDFDYCTSTLDKESLSRLEGTLPYISPELLSFNCPKFKELLNMYGAKDRDETLALLGPPMDLWALGCTVFLFRYNRFPPFSILLKHLGAFLSYFKSKEKEVETLNEEKNAITLKLREIKAEKLRLKARGGGPPSLEKLLKEQAKALELYQSKKLEKKRTVQQLLYNHNLDMVTLKKIDTEIGRLSKAIDKINNEIELTKKNLEVVKRTSFYRKILRSSYTQEINRIGQRIKAIMDQSQWGQREIDRLCMRIENSIIEIGSLLPVNNWNDDFLGTLASHLLEAVPFKRLDGRGVLQKN